jgi:DNA-binding LacI/PurR family transcriptional regulator
MVDGRRPTLEEVAAAAGVSRGTASRALTGGKNVSPKALEAVGRAAAELGYRPNLAARSLVLRRSGAIGLVVSESWDRVFAQPYFADIVRGVNVELAESGTQLLLAIVRNDEERRQFVRFGAGIHLDGALLVSFATADPFPESLEAAGVPVVAAGRGRFVRYSVDVDNRGGARRAVERLLAGGRRRIATIAGPGELAVSKDRLAGWRDALRGAGIQPDRDLIEVGDYGQPSGRVAAERLLARAPDIDGLFAASDLMAFGALEALRVAGRRVPGDVAVVGFDNVPSAAEAVPPLTTIAQPVVETGRRMTRLLLARLDEGAGDESHTVLPTELVERASA